MSERYGPCHSCAGTGYFLVRSRDGVTNEIHSVKQECSACGGTGHSGDAVDYMAQEYGKDWEHG